MGRHLFFPSPLGKRCIDAAAHWGMWPATVMVLSQWQAALLLGLTVPTYLSALTLAGTLTVYGADRWLERRSLSKLEARHRTWFAFDLPIIMVILVLTYFAIPRLTATDLSWLALLALAGSLYLLATVGRLPRLPLLKECIGAFCFTLLVWGRFQPRHVPLTLAFFALGLANFLFSSHGDRHRDAANQIPSLSVISPTLNLVLARCAALIAAVVFWVVGPLNATFPFIALALLVWPAKTKTSVDLTFLPLLALPLMV